MTTVDLLVEGDLDERVLRRIIEFSGSKLLVGTVRGKRGKSSVMNLLPKYVAASRFGPVQLALIDLDADAPCAAALVQRQTVDIDRTRFAFRVAVREVEAWIMASRSSFADFVGVPVSRIPENVDDITDPKAFLVNVCRTNRKPTLRRQIVPRPQATVAVGPAYNLVLATYVSEEWSPAEAVNHSESLRRCVQAVRTLSSA